MADPIAVDDPHDDRLADYRALNDPAVRRELERDTLFIAEGPVAVDRLMASGHHIRSLLVTPKAWRRLAPAVGDAPFPVYVGDQRVVNAVVGFDLHRGAVAAADRRPLPALADLVGTARRLVVLEGLNDPENLGAIARSARALGIDGAVLDPTCIDPYYRRTVRVSMGEVLFLPVARPAVWPDALDELRTAGFEIWALSPDPTGDSLWDMAVPERVAVVLGAEGPGLTAETLSQADRRVRIPIAADVDSLNVGAAAAVTFAALGQLPRR